MTIMTDPPKGSFRLSMLLNDTRYRSLTMQVIAAILLALAIFYLANNVATNLTRLGLNIDFSFLGTPAGYDINQRLIEYTSQSSNLKAAFVGILNTLLVASLSAVMNIRWLAVPIRVWLGQRIEIIQHDIGIVLKLSLIHI